MKVLAPRHVAWAAVGSLTVLAVAHSMIVLGRSHETTSDWASIEIRTRDVFSRHPPLIGAWSRYEWSHPGPLLFYALAIPYRLGGQTWQALWLGAILLNMVALGTAVWLALRRSAGMGAAVLLAGLAAVAWFRPHLLTDDWNATIVVLPVLTVLVAVVAVSAEDRAGLPVLVVASMFVAQCHFGYGVVLLPAATWGAVEAWRRWRRDTQRWLAVGVALWLPVMVDTVVHWPGNFLTSIGWNLTADERANGFGEAVRIVGRATSASWLRDPGIPAFDVVVDRPAIGTLPFIALVAAAGAWWVARHSGWRTERRVLEVLGLTWVTAFVAIARIKGPVYRWLVEWAEPLGALTWAVVVLVVLRAAALGLAAPDGRIDTESAASDGRAIATRAPTPAGPPIGCALVVLVAVTFVTTNLAGAVGEPYTNAQWVPIVRRFAVIAERDPRVVLGGPILVDLEGDLRLAGAVQSGLVNLLDKRGLQPRARSDQDLQFGDHRAGAARPEHLLVRAETTAEALPGAEVLGVWDPLTPAERAEADGLTADLAALLTANGLDARVPILDTPLAEAAALDAPPQVAERRTDFARLGMLRAEGERVALYFVPG